MSKHIKQEPRILSVFGRHLNLWILFAAMFFGFNSWSATSIDVCGRGVMGKVIAEMTASASCASVDAEELRKIAAFKLCGHNGYSICVYGRETIAATGLVFLRTATSRDFRHDLMELGPGAFDGFDSLLSADLALAPIKKIDPTAFRGATSLRALVMTGPAVLDDDTLGRLPTLEELTFYWGVNEIHGGAFRGLKSLKKLAFSSLEADQITRVDAGAFDGLDHLTELDLNGLSFDVLNAGIFRGLRSLKTLNLYSSDFKKFGHSVFADLGALERLSVQFYAEYENPASTRAFSRAYTGLPSSVVVDGVPVKP